MSRPIVRRYVVFAIKLVHSIIFLSVAASIVHMFYAGLFNRPSRWTALALGAALTESLVFAINRFQCPLRALAESYGAESGQVTDIFLPRWLADRIPLIFTPLLAIGVLGLIRNRQSTVASIRTAAGSLPEPLSLKEMQRIARKDRPEARYSPEVG